MNKIIVVFVLCVLTFNSCKKEETIGCNSNDCYDHTLSVGSANRDILKSETFKKLIIEVQYFPNQKPTENTLENLQTFVESVVSKPNGVELLTKEIPSDNQSNYSIENLRNIEDDHREYFSSNDTMAVYFVLVDAEYSGNQGSSKVLGVAHQNTSMALFQSTIKDLSGGIGEPSREVLETTVINHEFGHLLGLVNNNLSMQNQHQDSSHGHHCDNEDCLMYWLAETGGMVSNLIGVAKAPDLDQNCLNDLNSL